MAATTMHQSFQSESLERFKEYRRQGFGREAIYKMMSKDALLEIIFYFLEQEEQTNEQTKANQISLIEKAEIIYEK